MTLGARIAAAFALDDEGWARHANPLSVWSRVPVLPLFALAVWSRDWIGAWCLLPVAALVVWTAVNPRAFPPPADLSAWGSRAVMGERAWTRRDARPIPRHHEVWAGVLAGLPALGMVPLAWGLWALEPWPALTGVALVVLAKLWFLDRMAWLNDDLTREGRT